MKTKTLVLLILWFLMAVAAVLGLGYLTLYTDATYYTQIDNERVVGITPRGGMYYRYELPAYDENGKARMLSFETSRVLRDEAYLTVKVAPIRGVTEWAEVKPENIPENARTALGAAE